MHRNTPVLLTKARAQDVKARHLPHAPEWFPLDPKPTPENPDPGKYTDVQRTEARYRWAHAEARQGPLDGRRFVCPAWDEKPPEKFVPREAPTYWYLLDEAASTPHLLIYRYDPDCPAHGRTMAAVSEAFTQWTDPTYAQEARVDDPQTSVVPG